MEEEGSARPGKTSLLELESPDSSITFFASPFTISFASSFSISFSISSSISSRLVSFTSFLTVSPMAVGVWEREVEGVCGRVEEREEGRVEESRVESMEAWESPRVSKKEAPLLGFFLRLFLVLEPPTWGREVGSFET